MNTNNPNQFNPINSNNNQFYNNPQGQYPQPNANNIPYQNGLNIQQPPYNQSNNYGNQKYKFKYVVLNKKFKFLKTQ